MVGWSVKGKIPRQREKIYAILRARNDWMVTMDIQVACIQSHDDTIKDIAIPTIRRCLQELRDHRPPMAREWKRQKLRFGTGRFIEGEWFGIPIPIEDRNRNVE